MNASKKLARKKKMIRIAVIVAVVLVLLTVGVFALRNRVATQYAAQNKDEVEEAKVTVGSISTTVSGSGNLSNEDVEDLELYSTVKVKEIYVVAGEKVSAGDLLADVDMSTVLSAMSELQDQLDSKDDEIKAAVNDAVGSFVNAAVSGRVKAVYGSYGDDVATVMYEHGSLMILSLDGYMAVDIDGGSLKTGDALQVECSDGKRYDGLVSQIIAGSATVLISDDGPLYQDAVTVYSPQGKTLGGGSLYIHQPLNITGYAGTISAAYVGENTYVYDGTSLFYLDDTSYSAGYDGLLSDRQDLEELLQQLVVIYKEGAVYAQGNGSVTYVNEDTETTTTTTTTTTTATAITTTATGDSENTVVLLSICPDKTMSLSLSVDESDILSLDLGQEAVVTVDSIEDEEFPAVVTEIETSGSSSYGVTTYTVTVELDKTPQMLAGMSASAVISIEGVDNALLIPSEALHQTSSSSYVYTSYDEVAGEFGGIVQVTVGLNNDSFVEITSGLSQGDTVYYTPQEETSFDFGRMQGGMPGGMQGGGMQGGGGMPSGGGGMPNGGGAPGGRG